MEQQQELCFQTPSSSTYHIVSFSSDGRVRLRRGRKIWRTSWRRLAVLLRSRAISVENCWGETIPLRLRYLKRNHLVRGTLRIRYPGIYVLTEDVHVTPCASHIQCQEGGCVAVTIECPGVVLDLGGHTLAVQESWGRGAWTSTANVHAPRRVICSIGYDARCVIQNGTLGVCNDMQLSEKHALVATVRVKRTDLCTWNQLAGLTTPHNSLSLAPISSSGIRATCLPFPNYLTQGVAIRKFKVPALAHRCEFSEYRAQLVDGYSNPLLDFDAYVSSLQGTGTAHGASPTLSFSVTIRNMGVKLADRTLQTYQNVEAYSLWIGKNGKVRILANTYIGVGYALITLQQMLQPTGDGEYTIQHLPVRVCDIPRTYHRNTMIDTARTFFSVDSICQMVRKMGVHKLNHLDWHISDDQSFPLNVGPLTKIFSIVPSTDPNFLHMTGAFHPDKAYHLHDVQKIIRTAFNYGIVVEPGIDTPGHCSALMYGSKAASQRVLGTPIQIIRNWEMLYQGEANSPEPVSGYLDVTDPTKRTQVLRIIHAMFEEVYDAFEMGTGRYGRRFNINADEVRSFVIPNAAYTQYLNELLQLFTTPRWEKVQLSMWIDPVLTLNLTQVKTADGRFTDDYTYEDKVQLKRFDGRLTLGLWNLWPSVSVAKNNAVMENLPQSESINYNATTLYLDAGSPGTNLQGYSYDWKPDTLVDENSTTLKTLLNSFWISASSTQGPQYAPQPYRGWAISFGQIYTYNYLWDFTSPVNEATGASLSPTTVQAYIAKGTGTAKLKNCTGAGVALWSESANEGNVDFKIVANMAALSEMTWKYRADHAPDNLAHATYRLHYHLKQLRQPPYDVTSPTQVYSGSNIERQFPQGCAMTIPLDDPFGNIPQSYIDVHYANWKITILDEYQGMVNNNLLYNINPEGPHGAKAIAQCPLSVRFAFGKMSVKNGDTVATQEAPYDRVNNFLMEDIGKLLSGQVESTSRVGRSNFASSSPHFTASPFFTDQRDVCIKLEQINTGDSVNLLSEQPILRGQVALF